MSKQLQDAYIVSAIRTPIGKAPRGVFRHTRPDDLLVHTLKAALAQVPTLDKAGGYGIQDHAELIVERYSGSLSNIVGLPLETTKQILTRCGLLG